MYKSAVCSCCIDVLHRLSNRARALGLSRLFWEQMSRVSVSTVQSDDITQGTRHIIYPKLQASVINLLNTITS